MIKHKLILDTNIYNRVLDNKIQLSDFPDSEFYHTHIQPDELERTPDINRRLNLKNVFNLIKTSNLPTESFIIGTSRLDFTRMGDGPIYSKILEDLNKIEKKDSNVGDALISEVAIKNNLELVTMDETLKTVHLKYGGKIYCAFPFI